MLSMTAITPGAPIGSPIKMIRLLPEVRHGGGGSLLQLDGSAPIFSPRSAILFIVSLMKTPGCGGTQSLGTATNRTSTVAPRFSREISACA
jgi:hypothetical protein